MPTPESNSSSPNDDSLPPLDPEMLDLERRLGGLIPTAARSGCIDVAIERRNPGSGSDGVVVSEAVVRRGWLKFAPLGIAAVVMLTGGLLASKLERSSTRDDTHLAKVSEVAATHRQMVTISLENVLRETESDDVVEVEGYGLMRPVMLHFETAQSWIDPETETSVQVIRPWQELVFYPVATY